MQISITTATRSAEDISARVSEWSFDTRAGVGFVTAHISVRAPQRDLWYLLNASSEDLVEFRYAGVLVWRGYFAGATRRGTQLELTAEGRGMRLNDIEVWHIFADAEYGRWEPQDKVPEGFAADNNNRVYVEAGSGTYTDLTECVVTYPGTAELGGAIVRIEAHVLRGLWRGGWIGEVRDDAGNVLWTASTGTPESHTLFLDTPNGGTFTLGDGDLIETAALNWNDAAATIEAALQTAYSDATITTTAATDFEITFPTGGPGLQLMNNSLTYASSGTATCVLSESGEEDDIDEVVADAAGLVLALRKDGAGAGEASLRLTYTVVRTVDPSTTSAIISALLTEAGLGVAQIADSGLTVERALWQGEGRGTAIREMADLGDGVTGWRFTVYEQARLDAWPEAATWLLVAGEGEVEIGYQRDAVFNAVRVRLPDGYLTAWLTDTASITRWGRREKTLELGQTSQAEAARLAAVYLADYAWPVAGLRIAAGAVIRAADGSPWPAWRLRAGQVLTLRDVFPYRDVDIRIAETQATPGGISITPQGASNRLEVLLAAQERRLKRMSLKRMSG